MTKGKLYLVFFSLFVSFSSKALQNDSLQIVDYFNLALKNQNDSLLKEVQLNNARNVFQKDPLNLSDVFYFAASKYYLSIGQLDSSAKYIRSGITLYNHQPYELKVAKFYNLEGSILCYQKKYTNGIESFQKAIAILEYHDNELLAAHIRNNIANIFFTLNDFTSAFRYSQESYLTVKRLNDTINLPSIAAILGVSSLKIDSMDLARLYIDEALDLSDRYNSVQGKIIAHYAQGEFLLNEKKFEEAKSEYIQSLELSKSNRLANFIMLNNIGLLTTYIELNEFNEALAHGQEALFLSELLQNETPLYAIQRHLARAYAGLGEMENAYNFLSLAHTNFIETTKSENQKIINELLIKYESEKNRNKMNEQLLTIEKNEKSIAKRNVWILMSLLLAFFALLGIYFYRKNAKNKIESLKKKQELKLVEVSLASEEKEKERVSYELHDGLASGIAGVKMKLENGLSENNTVLELEVILNDLKSLHEETRKIAHNLLPLSLEKSSLNEAIELFCQENSSSKCVIHYSSNGGDFSVIKPLFAKTLYRITQELIQNVLKHAQSAVCFVQINLIENVIRLTVEDEGVGFDVNKDSNSQGLSGIQKRIKEMEGTVIIDSRLGTGSVIMIELNNVQK